MAPDLVKTNWIEPGSIYKLTTQLSLKIKSEKHGAAERATAGVCEEQSGR